VSATLPAPALILDHRGLVVDANDLALELLRHTRDELLGRAVGEVVEIIEPDGTPVRLRALRSQQIDGTTLCLLQVAPDDERAAEDLVSYFDAAFDHAPIGMAILDADGCYLRVNDALCTLFGRTHEQLAGARDIDITHPDDRERDSEPVGKVLRGELDCVQLEKRFIKLDGTIVWAIANMTCLRDDAGTAIAWVGQWQDITSHRAIEAKVLRERDLLAAMLAAMHEGFCHIDGDRVAQVNDAMCELVGWSREEIVGSSWPYLWVPEDEIEQQTLARVRWQAEGHGESEEFVLQRKDGGRFNASITSARATGPDGESLGYVVTIRDVSQRKRHEAELARQATHDTLTGLINTRGFQERLQDEVARCRRHGVTLSLVILDIDHFKHVNDSHGHPMGDRVLAEMGRRFRAMTRGGEHIARVGGEEFAWILPATDGAGAYAAAERARLAVEREPFEDVGHLTISAGVCELGLAGDVDELHRMADVALYWAKDHGRNIVFSYTPKTASYLEASTDPKAGAGEHRLRVRAMHALARIVEQGHPTSDGHAERVADLAAELAERLHWSPSAVRALRDAGVLHDVGKVIVPKSTLLKPGAFTAEEWVQMRRHPAVGDDMLEGVLSDMQRGWVRGHHERWDGRGYPSGLAADAISQGARILAVADSWDVMTSVRVYGEALAFDQAIQEVRRATGGQFDPGVAKALVELFGQDEVAEAAASLDT
jgi:diguanylate cyclase (GGDEF)-like protein/PAS domain S-box-containing protein